MSPPYISAHTLTFPPQITSRREKRVQDELQLKLDLEEDEQAEADYEELLREETERMALQGFQPKVR